MTGDAEVASLFDSDSRHYDEAYDAVRGHSLRARLAAVLEMVGPGPGSVLDGGMGPGRLCMELERCGWQAYGIDLSEEMVELARRRLPHARERLLQGSVEALPFEDDRFDAVVAMGVLEYVDDVPAVLRELERVLRPGGRIVVSIPNSRSAYGVARRHLWNPLIRRLKRTVGGFSRPAPYRMPPAIPQRRLIGGLRGAGLRPAGSRHVGYIAFPLAVAGRPCRGALRLAERIEAAQPHLARTLAHQLVVLAHKPPQSTRD
jgi:ubiquinone/menaquinone biosynthesis C-methylase UbiE